MNNLSQPIALTLIQQAICRLSGWVKADLHHTAANEGEDDTVLQSAKKYLNWPPLETEPQPLQQVFDAIHLGLEITGKKAANTNKAISVSSPLHFWPAQVIANTDPSVPYPLPSIGAKQVDTLKDEIKGTLEDLNDVDWQNFSLLTLILEKYGSYISYGEQDVAFYDLVKMTAAVASALANQPDAEEVCLIAGDLSGIQDFIYTIASDGALKSLRARSFWLELVTEEVVQQLLACFNLPRTSVIYAGGGNLYLLAPLTETTIDEVERIRRQFNTWLLNEFQGKVFLSLVSHPVPTDEISTQKFALHWEAAIKQLSRQKGRKFCEQLDALLTPQDAHEPCKVCHRDDSENLKPLGGDGAEACPSCNTLFNLGGKLFSVEAMVRSHQPSVSGELTAPLKIQLGKQTVYYHLFDNAKTIPTAPQSVYLINNWNVELYKFRHFENPTLLLLGNYGQESQETKDTFMTAAEMADLSEGIKRVGHLRMDVDRLGQIFANGLGDHYNLPRLSGLSRQMSYFFKVYLNSIARHRQSNLPENAKQLAKGCRDNLLFIYAGGDDLFVSGSWNQTVEFAFDVYQSFRAYTGWHSDITLSGGISLNGPKYPLYQSASDSGKAEGAAKGNGRDSLMLFDQVFKWQEWLGCVEMNVSEIPSITSDLKAYIGYNVQLERYGIFPFVSTLNQLFRDYVPRSFVQNLLMTAKLQEQQIKEAKETSSDQVRAIQYFLHLPKIAYTLARLPHKIRDAPEFKSVSSSLKSPYNAPYFRAIATWIDLLNRSAKQTNEQNAITVSASSENNNASEE